MTRAIEPDLYSIVVAHPFEAYLYPVSAFPVPPEEMHAMTSKLRRLTEELAKATGHPETFLQVAQIHLSDGPQRLGLHGRQWQPEIGLGVWPQRGMPTLYTEEEIKNLKEGEQLRRLSYQVFRMGGDPDARLHAMSTMLGLGTVLHLRTPLSSSQFLALCQETFKHSIKEESFRCYPFFVPLLELASLRNQDAAQLTEWLCSSELYIRESVEDGGVLILSSYPLSSVLPKIGLKCVPYPQIKEENQS